MHTARTVCPFNIQEFLKFDYIIRILNMTCSSGMITWSWYIIIELNYIIYLYKDNCIFIDYDSVQNGSNNKTVLHTLHI